MQLRVTRCIDLAQQDHAAIAIAKPSPRIQEARLAKLPDPNQQNNATTHELGVSVCCVWLGVAYQLGTLWLVTAESYSSPVI